MRLLTNLLFKVTISSMVLTAPAMISANTNYEDGNRSDKKGPLPLTASVIKRFVDHPTVIAMRAFPAAGEQAAAASSAVVTTATTATAIRSAEAKPVAEKTVAEKPVAEKAVAEKAIAEKTVAEKPAEVKPVEESPAVTSFVASKNMGSKAADAKAAELRMVIRQAALIYVAMDLENTGLDSKAFEYAWRGYHNLVKKGLLHRRAVLSICDFSQSSRNKRMYVIDVQHKKLLYRTYVAHGQNSGDEFANAFSNAPDSYMSSLGFYITRNTYVGRNGLSLRLDGVDLGYNDMAKKRMIVLHGSSYAGEKYMQDYGNLGTSLGCPALPSNVSGRIIRTVKDGSCLFIYHPTQQYLDNSTILHG